MLFTNLYKIRNGLILLLTPIILSPLLIWNYHLSESRCAFVSLLMIIYWITQPIPLPVTALLPVILFPLMDLSSTEKACEPYLQATNMLFMASLIIAIAMESSGFHERIALRTLLLMGDDIRVLFGGFMVITMFLGIWIINTAATAMILPIADVVIEYLFDKNINLELIVLPDDSKQSSDKYTTSTQNKSMLYVKRLLYICIAYSATIGGTTTLTSNGPNLVFRFVLDEFYNGRPPVDYTNWLLFCLPATLFSILFCWLAICFVYLR